MKSIFRTIVFVLAFLAAVSCKMEFLRIRISGTTWSQEKDDVRAFVHFDENGRATVLQRDKASGVVQVSHGTYSADGHAVIIQTDEGSSLKMVRTFSHLKSSSTNRNFSSLYPEEYQSVSQSILASMKQDDFRMYYFKPDGNALQLVFKNARHEEGIPYGWEKTEEAYTLTGSNLTFGNENAILFPEVMLKDDIWYKYFPSGEDKGTSAVSGTVWTYQTDSFPGVIVFNNNGSFTRILVSSRILFQFSQGSYSQSENTLTMTLDGKTETCKIVGGVFTFMEKTYVLFE